MLVATMTHTVTRISCIFFADLRVRWSIQLTAHIYQRMPGPQSKLARPGAYQNTMTLRAVRGNPNVRIDWTRVTSNGRCSFDTLVI